MAFGFPYRVRIWQRVAPSPRGLIGFVTLAIPATIGFALLFVTIPMIGSLLAVERKLFEEPFDEIVIHSGCEDVLAWVTVEPDEHETTRFVEGETTVEPFKSGVTVELDDGVDPECSRVEVELFSPGAGRPTFYDCMQCDAEVIEASPEHVRVALKAGAGVLRFEWPGLYRHSHEGRGVASRLIGPYAAMTNLYVHAAVGYRGRLEVDVSVAAPEGYKTSDAEEFYIREYDRYAVRWSNVDREKQDAIVLKQVFGSANFRTDSFEAKTNYVLIAGGAAVGLGLTLLVESLIGLLFRLERVVLARLRSRRPRQRGEPQDDAEPPEAGPQTQEEDESPEGEDADPVDL